MFLWVGEVGKKSDKVICLLKTLVQDIIIL